MKNILIGLVVIVLLVLGWFLFARDQGQWSLGEVRSDDDMVTLMLGENALPEGTDAEDISIRKLEGDFAFTAYELSPNGLVFSEPVRVEAILEGNSTSVPLLFSASDDADLNDFENLELLENLEVKHDEAANRTIIAGDLAHFSRLIFWDGWFEKKSRQGSIEFAIGEPFEEFIEIRTGAPWREYIGDTKRWSIEVRPDTRIFWTTNNVVPVEVRPPARANLGQDDVYRFDMAFACRISGRDRLVDTSGFRITWPKDKPGLFPGIDDNHFVAIAIEEPVICSRDKVYAPPEITAPAVNPGIEVRGLEGLKQQ